MGHTANQSSETRLFLSSTFADLQRERNALARFTFPVVRQAYVESGMTFSERDLRWGIAVESSEEFIFQKCIDSIDDCDRHFIGILGNRYGWVPDQIPTQIQSRSTIDLRGKSITEIEILVGVLQQSSMNLCEFFFKSTNSSADDPRLKKLKETIANSAYKITYFNDPEQLSALITQTLMRHLQKKTHFYLKDKELCRWIKQPSNCHRARRIRKNTTNLRMGSARGKKKHERT
jgi:hypothetical protein